MPPTAFAECVLLRAADLWVQASLEQRQRQDAFYVEFFELTGLTLIANSSRTILMSRQLLAGNRKRKMKVW